MDRRPSYGLGFSGLRRFGGLIHGVEASSMGWGDTPCPWVYRRTSAPASRLQDDALSKRKRDISLFKGIASFSVPAGQFPGIRRVPEGDLNYPQKEILLEVENR